MPELPPELMVLWNKVVKKHYKINLVNSANEIVGHSLSIGNPGSGKTSGDKREVEIRYAKGHKIFCLYDAGRCDMAYFMFPSVSDFWRKPKIEGHKIVGARSYPVTLLYPVTRNIPKKLPHNAIPFTIGVNDLDENDYTSLVGMANKDTIKSALYSMERYVDKNTTPQDYLNILGNSLAKTQDLDKIKLSSWSAKRLKGDVFNPLINEGLLTASSSDTTINLRDLLLDKKTIHVLILRHCPQNLWSFLVHYFMNHLFKILGGLDDEKKIKQKTTIVLNEVADLLDVDAETGSSSDAISSMISKLAKQSRTSDLFMELDTQIPQSLPNIQDTMTRVYVYNSGVAEVQKAMEIIGVSTRTGEIGSDDLMLIPRLPKGYYYLFDRNNGVSFHKLIWTRSRTYLDGEDFYDIYDKICGKSSYVDITKILDKLKKERDDSEKIWKLKSDIQKAKAENFKKNKKEIVKKEEDEYEEEIEEEIIEKKIEKIKEPQKVEKKIIQKIEKVKEISKKDLNIPIINGSKIKEEIIEIESIIKEIKEENGIITKKKIGRPRNKDKIIKKIDILEKFKDIKSEKKFSYIPINNKKINYNSLTKLNKI